MACPLGVHILTLSRSQSLLAFWSPGQNSEVTEDWGPVGNRLPVTTRVRAIYTPDSHGGYWVSPVKMMPKLPGITHQITYYSTTKSTTNMDGAI